VRFFASSGAHDYPFELVLDGQLQTFRAGGWLAVNDAENYALGALRGCGLIQLPRFHVEEDLRAGRLVEVLGEWKSPDMALAALYPQRRQLSPRVRVFVDWLAKVYQERFGVLS
jgi:DNA-binding transcriptional LysR family regulator